CVLFSGSSDSHHLYSFPPRRSSDLTVGGGGGREREQHRRGPGDLDHRPAREGAGREQRGEGGGYGQGAVIDTGERRRSRRWRGRDRKSTRLNSSHAKISYAVFCLKK